MTWFSTCTLTSRIEVHASRVLQFPFIKKLFFTCTQAFTIRKHFKNDSAVIFSTMLFQGSSYDLSGSQITIIKIVG